MKATNDLIVVGKMDGHLDEIVSGLKDRDWNITHVENIQKSQRTLHNKQGFLVGIIYLDTACFETLWSIEGILNEFSTRWIAVTPETVIKDASACRMISRLFSGYHTISTDLDKLHQSLSHQHSFASLVLAHHDDDRLEECQDCHMVGASPAMKALYRTIHKVSTVDAPVFIQGESGTGKELTARAIHEESLRASAPFNAINCGALPANLIQSELFGHEKGAFTGASQRKVGIIEGTEGGTLFLDEIGDLPLDMQVNLLRFLENRTIQRVGGLKEITVDVRVLAATHVNLEEAVEKGTFREDLFHRLNVLHIKIPPLRERGDDIEILARHFFDQFANEKSIQVRGFTRESLAIMRLYEWPGNIRELINRIRRAMVMCEHSLIRPTDLGLERRQSASRYAESLEEARDIAERSVVMAALARNSFNIQHTARELGISRVTLYRLMDKHDINRGNEATGGKGESWRRHSTSSKILHLSSVSKSR
ncbi:sigma 54-interacting transcriptional regulator [Halomonas sp. THAF12]|uniref:sigma-54 dependent transcriptional regulator n=1 Tax=Halomonas sp. B23F22_10 TaxID=3459515 RepID=UPI00373FA23F